MSPDTRILIVEDDVAVARAVARVLDNHGMTTVVARSVEEAEEAGGGFDAGVFDVDLPDGNGIVLAEHLLARGCVGLVLFHSGESAVETRLAASELGSFSPKSDGIHALYKLLLEALADSGIAARAVGAEDVTPGGTPFRSGPRAKLR